MEIEKEPRNYYDYFVQKVRIEQEKIKLNRNFDEFDIRTPFREYFKTFDCLEVEDGWQIDCYYAHSNTGGKPVIYVRKPDEDIDELLSRIDNKRYMYDHRIFEYCQSVNTIDHLKVTDIEKGLFQLLMLDMIGEDFAIYWHAGYGRKTMICSKRELYEISEKILDKERKSEIEKANDFPTIEESKDCITYRILTFNSWRGLAEESYSIKKAFPHKISLIEAKILVSYDCGLRY
ncbi:MAG: hypothetical protein HXX13_10000 [Bacteroidetes bacterium]|nr:hypothetical protein [Bacteroidota bacterium]